MNFWLMKSEEDVFSYQDLIRSPQKTTGWEGVRNYQARNFMKNNFKIGDQVLFYHSNSTPTGIAGIAQVVREAYPDDSALDPKSPYFDEKSALKKESRWVKVDIQATRVFKEFVTLESLKSEKSLKDMLVLQKGNRLSVTPVKEAEFKKICELGQLAI